MNNRIQRSKKMRFTLHASRFTCAGFSFIETLVATAIFLFISLAVYEGHTLVFKLVSINKSKTAALELANERIEVIRNLPYADIGVVDGIPDGVIPKAEQFTRAGLLFWATTTVRNIDDTFDGTIGGTPNDLSPADYKLVELDIDCPACKDFSPINITAVASPKSLETTSGNGALFVRVINASGLPVPDAEVLIEGQGTSTVSISELTNNEGLLQIVDIPPGSFMYRVTVSKTGFSTESTYAIGDVSNPNPLITDSTISAGSVTQLTFAIDALGSLDIKTTTEDCTPVASVPFTFRGNKKIGTVPDTYKTDGSYTTNGSGLKSLSNVEWDTYNITLGGGFVGAGSIPLIPFSLDPGAAGEVIVVARTPSGRSLLVTVKDSGTGLPLTDASVRVNFGGFDETVVTNKGFLRQTDWSGGSGQVNFSDNTRFSSSDGQIEYTTTSGELSLKQFFGDYVSSGELLSSWFDVGSSTTLHKIEWEPFTQATSTGEGSVLFQIESTNDVSSSSTGFVGPDGTGLTFYTPTTTDISIIHIDNRFVRYKAFLSTLNASSTPIVSDVAVTYGTECLPYGQAYFDDLSPDTYNVSVTKSGYDPYTGSVNMSVSSEEVLDVPLSEI